MCPHKSWFSSCQIVDNGIFLMGNNVPWKTFGVGRINIKMFDGIVRTSIEVRHVNEFKGNLISLGFLDFKGYKFIGQSGAL